MFFPSGTGGDAGYAHQGQATQVRMHNAAVETRSSPPDSQLHQEGDWRGVGKIFSLSEALDES